MNHCFYILFFLSLVFWNACTPQGHYLTETDIIRDSIPSPYQNSYSCSDFQGYLPDTNFMNHNPLRIIRVNVHFTNTDDGTCSFTEEKAKKYGRDLIRYMNNDLKANQAMRLPLGNDTPCLPINYRYELCSDPNDEEDTGVYMHYNDELCFYIHKGKNRNRANRDVIRKYAKGLDSILNIFVMPHPPDSVLSPTYDAVKHGIALGSAIKVSGVIEEKKYAPWEFRGLINHEIGHVLGLSHAWGRNDGCDDTPPNPNCWHKTRNGSACDSLASNNVMDYNNKQNAWSPCQIGRIHRNFSRLGSKSRNLLKETWCELNPDEMVVIDKAIHWRGARDLESHIQIEKGGELRISCRVSLPAKAEIRVMPGGKLILDNARIHNDCGEQWEGIKVFQKGKNGLKGEVVFRGKVRLEDVVKEPQNVKQENRRM